MPDQHEEPLDGAIGAVRVGTTIRKVAGPWTETVHTLLRFLLDAGFDLVPEPRGFDERGREVLSWLDGRVASRPWPSTLLTNDGVAELGRVLRRYHDVVRRFDAGPAATWRAGRRAPREGEV